jgi:holliday junction DNA helicase RuvA
VYDYIEGECAERTPARLVLHVGGPGGAIAYEVQVPISSRFPAKGRARAWTHLVVREDAHTLYGFEDRETRHLFRLLLSVRGVGPTVALTLLSGLPRGPLVAAIAAGDAETLTRIRGIGAKTAHQILLDLKDKATILAHAGSKPADGRRPAGEDPVVEDAVAALLSIGYSEKDARASVERAAKTADKKDLESLVRAALVAG